MIEVSFTGKRFEGDLVGIIKAGDFYQDFVSSEIFVKKPYYENQWYNAISNFYENRERQVIITSINLNPSDSVGSIGLYSLLNAEDVEFDDVFDEEFDYKNYKYIKERTRLAKGLVITEYNCLITTDPSNYTSKEFIEFEENADFPIVHFFDILRPWRIKSIVHTFITKGVSYWHIPGE